MPGTGCSSGPNPSSRRTACRATPERCVPLSSPGGEGDREIMVSWSMYMYIVAMVVMTCYIYTAHVYEVHCIGYT